MMRKIYTSLMLLAMMMVSMVAKAQDAAAAPKLSELSIVKEYTMTLNFNEGKTSDGTFTTTLDGLYDALGTTAEEFDAASHGNFWTQVVAEGAWVDELQTPDAAAGGAWFGRYTVEDATVVAPQTWGTQVTVGEGDEATKINTSVYYLQELKVTNGEMSVNAGSFGKGAQGPVLVEGDADYAYLYIVNGTNAAKVKVQVNITKPSNDFPAPETHMGLFTIVKDYELKLPFTLGKSYEGKTYEATFEDIYETLGIEDAESFDAAAADFTFTQVVNGVETAEGSGEYTYIPADALVTPSDASGGAWYGRYTNFDEDAGKEVTLPMNYPKAWNAGANTFYTQDIKLAEGKFSITSGQFPDVLKEGDTDYTYLYIIYGDKAARVKVYVEVTPPEAVDPDQFTKVGETTVKISATIDDSYATTAFTVDMDPIYEALGCESSDLDDIYAWASEGVVDNNHTESSGGFYFNNDGYIANWGASTSSFFVALTSTTSFREGKYKIGQMAGVFTNITEDTTVAAQLVYQNAGKYYVVNVEYTVKLPEASDKTPDDEFGEIVATLPITFEIKPAGSYYGDMDAEGKAAMELDLNIESIKVLLGEGTYEVFGLKAPATAEALPQLTQGTGYGPNSGFDSGFWMAMPKENLGDEYVNTAFVGSWGTNSYGIEWKLNDGIFGFDQIPGQRSVGDTYTSTFYWALADKSKAIKYLLTVKYVEEPNNSGSSATIIGSIDKMIEESEAEEGFSVQALVLEAFGIDAEEWESVVPRFANTAATYGSALEDGTSEIMKDGFIYEFKDGEEAPADCYGVTYEDNAVSIDPMDIPFAESDESKALIRMAFDYTDGEGQTSRVLLNITVVSKDSPLLNINGIGVANTGKTAYFTLQGTPLTVPAKGLSIKKQGNKAEIIYTK